MNIITRLGLILGLLLLIGLILWQGAIEVLELFIHSGWVLLWIPVAWLPNLIPATQAWRLLFEKPTTPRFIHGLLAMWMGRAVNNLLPVATIGGEIVKARLVHIWGCKGTTAAASVIVDKTIQVISIIIWGLTGVALLLLLTVENQIALYALAGFAILTLCATGLFFLQRAGMFSLLARVGEKLVKTDSWEGVSLSAREVDDEILGIYQHRNRIRLAVILKVSSLLIQAAEVWLACYLLGHPVGILEAVMVKSLTSTLSDVAFVIPNAYGVQEGAFILIGSLVGLSPDVSLAVSLTLRIRDLLFDPPGLLALHGIESKRFFKKSPEATAES